MEEDAFHRFWDKILGSIVLLSSPNYSPQIGELRSNTVLL
jgi:hypothetical protein